MEYKNYGYWADGGKEYVITERKTPRHWYNYFFNDEYVGFVSQVGFGEGFCQDFLGRRAKIVADRCVYICDKQKNTFHTAVGLPMKESYDHYECHHGIAYSVIICEKNGIRTEYTVFVPKNGMREVWNVKVTNLRGENADLSVVAYAAHECDGPYTPQGYNSFKGMYFADGEVAMVPFTTEFESKTRRFVYSFMMSSETPVGYDTRKSAFIGMYGSKEEPEALVEACGCKNSDTAAEKSCFALEIPCKLEAGESKEISFCVGYLDTKDEIVEFRKSFSTETAKALLEEVKATRLQETDGVFIKTPDENLNLAFNYFYKYATDMGSRWARVRHNGYRDMTGDTECFGSFNPTLAWERFKRILTYQYSTGYCPRTIIDGAIRPNNFSDNAVWINYTAYSIVNELGDISLLDEEVKFNDGTSAPIFEHLRRAIEFLFNFQGMHGLIKIWGGDWNDGMNGAGLKEIGVSVWLSIAWVRANKRFMDLCRMTGRDDLIETHEKMCADMTEKIKKYGWDGEYFITAINDKGEKIGSKESRGGNMYLNPQLWAVWADLLPGDELEKLMETVDRNLDTPLGTLVNNPGYDDFDAFVGGMTGHPKGTLINQGVYLHPMGWKLTVEGIMKRNAKMEQTLKQILPWDRDYAPTCGEPYILYNFYFGPEVEYRYGTPGQSWRTGTTQCVTKAIINSIFGLVPTIEGLRLDPCLPPSWDECSIKKNFRGVIYDIHYHNGNRENRLVLVNGEEYHSDVLPLADKGTEISVDIYL